LDEGNGRLISLEKKLRGRPVTKDGDYAEGKLLKIRNKTKWRKRNATILINENSKKG